MTLRTTIIAALLAAAGLGTASLGSASLGTAAEIKPASGASLGLGGLAGVAYYTAEPKGYRVVVTLAPRAAAPALRFEAVLGPDQSVTLSTPRAAGEAATAIEIRREGTRVLVTEPASGVVREAAAR